MVSGAGVDVPAMFSAEAAGLVSGAVTVTSSVGAAPAGVASTGALAGGVSSVPA